MAHHLEGLGLHALTRKWAKRLKRKGLLVGDAGIVHLLMAHSYLLELMDEDGDDDFLMLSALAWGLADEVETILSKRALERADC